MSRQNIVRTLAVVAVLGTGSLARAVDWNVNPWGLENLLKRPGVSIAQSTAQPSESDSVKLLVDGDAATSGVVSAQGNTADVVFSLGEKPVAAERLVIRLPANAPPQALPERVEILISETSPLAGFRAIRADKLEKTADAQKFSFPSTAARYVMLRFTPAQGAQVVAVSDVELWGKEGSPATHYEFSESPAKAFDVLSRLRGSTFDVSITPDEQSLFEDAKDGKFDQFSFAEAALLASGVKEKEKREQYLKAIDRFEATAKQAIGAAKDSFEQGEKLLVWLHAGPMKAGYERNQTDLSVIVDTNKFNCVSSATLYNVLARRLGLDARAIEVPDHAFSILYDGTRHADVETTTRQGFNPARDPEARASFEAQTGFRYIPDSHRDQRREIGEPGLVAVIYYNHGVDLTNQKRYHEALVTYFRALSLDAEFASAVKNSLAVLANWSKQLADEGQFEQAIAVLATGLDLAPADGTLLHNRRVVWNEWADKVSKTGDKDTALALLERAAKEVPSEAEYFQSRQAWIFVREGEKLAAERQWEQALAAIQPGFDKLTGRPLEELRDWQNGIYLRWAQKELDAEHFEQAASVLEKGLENAPQDYSLNNNLAYTVQQWVRFVLEHEGEAQAKEVLLRLLAKYREVQGVKDVADNHIFRLLRKLEEAGKYNEALAAVDRNREILVALGKENEADELAATVYDAQARKLVKEGHWADAVAVYAEGLQKLPDQSRLTGNLAYNCQEWLDDVRQHQGEEAARKIALALLAQFPDQSRIKEVVKHHCIRVVVKLKEAGKFEEGVAAIERHQDVLDALGDQGAKNDMVEAVFDGWARSFWKNGKWEEAIAIYQQGLQLAPDDSLLENNLDYCRHMLSKADK
ncbi:MAG: hypothetical protein HYX69_02630 [Planctomycetia bacterium]|nr:hypothetical protein [Planctomycetia bacterium]